MSVPMASEACSQCRALEQQLARSTAELADARAATEAARSAVASAHALNAELLAQREQLTTAPELAELRHRSLLLDELLATRTFRWSRAPRRVYGAARRLGRRTRK